jgi:hypothetical protein
MSRPLAILLVLLALTPLALAAGPSLALRVSPSYTVAEVATGKAQGRVLAFDATGAPLSHVLVHVSLTRADWPTDVSRTAQLEGFTENDGSFTFKVSAFDAVPARYLVDATYATASVSGSFDVVPA